MAGPVAGAFEGAGVFRGLGAGVEGIFPPAMNSPARLPLQPYWLSLAWGQPLGQPWAASNTASAGGAVRGWRGAVSIWSSGDELYRESSLTTAVARQLGGRFTAGVSLAYNSVTIPDFDHVEGEILIGLGVVAPFSPTLELALWYAGLTVPANRAYDSLTRQLFQLALISDAGRGYRWMMALEKTPGYDLAQLVEFQLFPWRKTALQLGYRTSPGLPYLGLRLPLRRLTASLRVNLHPIFGLSTAFGISFK